MKHECEYNFTSHSRRLRAKVLPDGSHSQSIIVHSETDYNSSLKDTTKLIGTQDSMEKLPWPIFNHTDFTNLSDSIDENKSDNGVIYGIVLITIGILILMITGFFLLLAIQQTKMKKNVEEVRKSIEKHYEIIAQSSLECMTDLLPLEPEMIPHGEYLCPISSSHITYDYPREPAISASNVTLRRQKNDSLNQSATNLVEDGYFCPIMDSPFSEKQLGCNKLRKGEMKLEGLHHVEVEVHESMTVEKAIDDLLYDYTDNQLELVFLNATEPPLPPRPILKTKVIEDVEFEETSFGTKKFASQELIPCFDGVSKKDEEFLSEIDKNEVDTVHVEPIYATIKRVKHQ